MRGYFNIALLDYQKRKDRLSGTLESSLFSQRIRYGAQELAFFMGSPRVTRETTHFEWKLSLTRRLYEQGHDRRDVVNLFRFIDWVMQLPEELEEGFWREIQAYEEAKHMPYMTSVERIGIRKGIEQGRQEGRQEGIQQGEALMLRRLLTRRFGLLPPWVEERLARADRESLERWAERLLEAATLEEVFEGA